MEDTLNYLNREENEKFCRMLAKKLSDASVKIELNFNIDTMAKIDDDGIHMVYRPYSSLSDVSVNFDEHDKRIREQVIKELIGNIPEVKYVGKENE